MIKISKKNIIDADDKGVMKIEILDPNIYKILFGLSKILPPMNVEEVTILDSLKYSPDIAKISKKYIPLDHNLWIKCLDNSKVNKDAYVKLAIEQYEGNGGRWKVKNN